MSLRDHVVSVRHGWRWIAALVLLGVVAGAVMASAATPKFVSTTRFFVASAVDSPDPEELFNRNQIAQQRVQSYVELMLSDTMTEAVIEELGDAAPAGGFADNTTATAPPETVILDVQVTGNSPEEAQNIAAAYAAVAPGVVADVESAGTVKGAQVALTPIEAPQLGERETPTVLRAMVFGGLLGLVVGLGITVLWSAVRREARMTSRSANADPSFSPPAPAE